MENQEFVNEQVENRVSQQESPLTEADEQTPALEEETKVSAEESQPTPDALLQSNAELSDIKCTLQSLGDAIAKLNDKFDEKIANDEYKDQLFDKMYQELATYKKDLYAKLMSPFINETIALMADYERVIAKLDTLEPERMAKYISDIPSDLTTLLENNGVETYEDQTDVFNPKTQRAIRVVPTSNEEDNNKIAERLHSGYRWNGITLKPESVAVYKYQEGSNVQKEPLEKANEAMEQA